MNFLKSKNKKKLKAVIVDDIRQGTFYAKLLIVTAGGEEKKVDARPSDAIALALRAEAPIFVEEEVLQLTGMTADA